MKDAVFFQKALLVGHKTKLFSLFYLCKKELARSSPLSIHYLHRIVWHKICLRKDTYRTNALCARAESKRKMENIVMILNLFLID